MNVWLWTDGACSGNPGPSGSGLVVTIGNRNEWNKHILVQECCWDLGAGTNNTAELNAFMQSLLWIIGNDVGDYPIVITSDSNYVVQGINEWMEGWKRRSWKKVKNPELWQHVDELWQQVRAKCSGVTVEHTYGHAGMVWNEAADKLAVRGRLGETSNVVH